MDLINSYPYAFPAAAIVTVVLCCPWTMLLREKKATALPGSALEFLEQCPMSTRSESGKNLKRREYSRVQARKFSVIPNPEPPLRLGRRLSLITSDIFSWIKSSGEVNEQTGREPKDFWKIYKMIATQRTGLLGPLHSYEFPGACLTAIVAIADALPEIYSRNKPDSFRYWISRQFSELDPDAGISLRQEITAMDNHKAREALGAVVYIRHAWHQGAPGKPAISTLAPLDAYGQTMLEPPQLTICWSMLQEKLEVNPFLNVFTWLFCNWTWKPTKKHTNPNNPTYEDLLTGVMSPRFYWSVGDSRRSEENFWRAFMYSEVHAIPMYGAVGKVLEIVQSNSAGAKEKEPPEEVAIDIVLSSLRIIQRAMHNIAANMETRVDTDLINVEDFIEMQNTAHYAGTSAGASGFQSPFIILMDAFLGIDYSKVPVHLQATRIENLEEVYPNLLTLVNDCVVPSLPILKDFAQRSGQYPLFRDIVNVIIDKLQAWRVSHRGRAQQWLKESAITTGRTNEGMHKDVRSTFLNEMDDIVKATKLAKWPKDVETFF